MILFVDDVADLLEIYNASVVVLEKVQGIMDVIHWVEKGRFDLKEFDVVGIMVGRSDAKRSTEWFMSSVEEFIHLVRRLNPTALILLGAVVPSVIDTKEMINSFVRKNAALQERNFARRDGRFLEYTRSGRDLVAKGGVLRHLYGEDDCLNKQGRLIMGKAIAVKFTSAGLVRRCHELRRGN